MQASQRSALLIVDMQIGLFHGPDIPFERDRMLRNIRALIFKARFAHAPVFAARHTGPPGSPIERGSRMWQLLPELELNSDLDTIFDKYRPSCFFGTGLAAQLLEANVQQLMIAGMKTQYCIDTTCRVAAEFGFKVVLVADAHTCMDTPLLPAPIIIEHHNVTLNGPFVRLLNTEEIVF